MTDGARIRDVTRRARERLESDASDELERRLGWRRDGAIEASSARSAPDAERALLARFIDERRDAGDSIDAARRRLCRDAAFDFLRRGVERRMLAARGLRDDDGELGDREPRLLSLLEPRPPTRDAVLRDIEPASFGEPTALGSVYLHFAEGDIERDEDAIARRTRLYTPPWIARFLVENTLGRLWLEAHPDSRVSARLPWLVPRPARRQASPPLARDVTVLEPACGAFHVGLAAFDVLHAMHVEEIERAGEPGWPAEPSVAARESVPESIVARSLAGFDVDARAVDVALAALGIESRARGGPGRFERHRLLALDGPLGTLARDPAVDGPFDVVVTNPPYLDRSDCVEPLRGELERRFPEAKRNLYAAFVADGLRRLREGGRLGVVTPQSFLFVSSFGKLRASIRGAAAYETLVHAGLGTFPGAVVDCALTVIRRERDARARDAEEAICFRLVRERGPEAKARALAAAIASLREGRTAPRSVFRVRASDHDAVPGAPFVYWARPRVRALFRDLAKLAAVASPRQGLATTDNGRFVRRFWEVEPERIARGCRSREEAIASGAKWFPYMKGGPFRRFSGNRELVVDWADDGRAIKAAIASAYPYLGGRWEWVAKNSGFYFRPGITYSYLTSGPFSARLMPAGFVFDVAGSALFPGGGARRRLALLALLNSSAAAHLLSLVNPTVNFQVGDLARVPVPRRASERLARLAREAVALARADDAERETSPDFVAPPEDAAGPHARAERLAAVERAIDEEAFRLYGIAGRDRAAIARESGARPRADAAASEDDEAGVARRWVAYAAGLALGRFRRGLVGAPFFLAAGDLADRAWRALVRLRGEARAAATVDRAIGHPDAAPAEALVRHFARDFYDRHAAAHAQRPPLLLLRSERGDGPGEPLAVWIAHARVAPPALEAIADLAARAGRPRMADVLRRAVASGAVERARRESSVLATIAALEPLVPGTGKCPPARSRR